MPRTISSYAKDFKQVTKTYSDAKDDSVTITYRPDVFTPKVERLFQEQASSTTPSQAFLTLLPRLIVSWDLLGEDGKPLALTPEALEEVPREVLGEVVEIVITDMKPDPTSAAT